MYNQNINEIGCTPCECGVPGACIREQLPSFLQFLPDSFIISPIPYLLIISGIVLIIVAIVWIIKNQKTGDELAVYQKCRTSFD